ncbi:MAG: heavy-metal-associated domain-containing protein [Armatimonadota bacterium]
MEKVTFRVPTIGCDGCLNNIRRALTKMPGVLAVEGDLKTKVITIVRNEGTARDEELIERIAETGHTAVGSSTERGI